MSRRKAKRAARARRYRESQFAAARRRGDIHTKIKRPYRYVAEPQPMTVRQADPDDPLWTSHDPNRGATENPRKGRS